MPKLGVRHSGFLIHLAMDMGSSGMEWGSFGRNWGPFGMDWGSIGMDWGQQNALGAIGTVRRSI